MKRAYVDIPEGQIHYRIEGTGEPLLMLHQTALSSDEFSEVIPVLGKSYRVVAMDVMGYGNSDMPPREYKVEDYTQSIIHFLDALDIKKTNVIGHHNGAAFAVEMAAAYPERVDKLVLSGCPYLAQEVRQARLEQPRYKPMEIKADGSHLAEWWNYYSSRWSHFKPEIIQRILADYLRAGLGTKAVSAYWPIYQYDIEPRLQLIKSPTLLITGTYDIFHDRLGAIKNLIPRCRTHIIEGAHDHSPWEKPDEFAQTILEYLQDPRV